MRYCFALGLLSGSRCYQRQNKLLSVLVSWSFLVLKLYTVLGPIPATLLWALPKQFEICVKGFERAWVAATSWNVCVDRVQSKGV